MDHLFVSSKREAASTPVFGLRYMEEEAAEINSVVGCFEVDPSPIDGGGGGGGGGYTPPTYYTTNCDYQDVD